MADLKQYPTLDPAVRAVPASSSVDGSGRPICVYCLKGLRFRAGWGYNGTGHFCNIRCAAEWADYKVEGTCDETRAEAVRRHDSFA